MIRLSVQITGAAAIERRIRGMLGNGSPGFMPAPQYAGMFVLDLVAEIFATSGHGSWPPSVRAQLLGEPTLVDTGALRDAILSMSRRASTSRYYLIPTGHGDGSSIGNPGEVHEAAGIFRIKKDQVEVGVRSKYGVRTQEGFVSLRYGKAIAARPFLYFRPQDRQFIVANWLKWAGRSFN